MSNTPELVKTPVNTGGNRLDEIMHILNECDGNLTQVRAILQALLIEDPDLASLVTKQWMAENPPQPRGEKGEVKMWWNSKGIPVYDKSAPESIEPLKDILTPDQMGSLVALLSHLQRTTTTSEIRGWVMKLIPEKHDVCGIGVFLAVMSHIRDYREGGLGFKAHSMCLFY